MTHQLSSKNLSPGEKLAMMDEFKEEVRIENEKKKKETEGRPPKNLSPVGDKINEPKFDTRTDAQVAAKAGVGVGTVVE